MSVRSSRLAGKPKRATPSSAGKTLPRFHDWRKNCNARSEWTLSLCNPESLNLRFVSTVNACDEIERQGSSVRHWKGQCPFSDIGQCGHAESPPPLIVVLFHHHLHRLGDRGDFGGRVRVAWMALPLPQQPHEARLLEVVIGGQSLGDTALLHDDERCAIHEAPVLVLAGLQKLPGLIVEGGIYVDDFNVRRRLQISDEGNGLLAGESKRTRH